MRTTRRWSVPVLCTIGAAGPHFNTTGSPPAAVNPATEVWLDFVVKKNGTGKAEATVPFVIPAGARWACPPVVF